MRIIIICPVNAIDQIKRCFSCGISINEYNWKRIAEKKALKKYQKQVIKQFLSTVERSQNGTEDHKTEHLDHKMEHFYKKNDALLGFISPTKMRLMTKDHILRQSSRTEFFR